MQELFLALQQVYHLSAPSTAPNKSCFLFLFTACQTPAALLQQLCSLRSEKQDEDAAARIIGRPTGGRNKDLIQVISSTCTQPQEPEHRLEVMTDAAGAPSCVELTVELPKVCSMSNCQLRISEVSAPLLLCVREQTQCWPVLLK